MPNCLKCQCDFPNRVEIDGKFRNLQRRKYCLECSPYHSHNTVQIHLKEKNKLPKCKKCTYCEQVKSSTDFYRRRKNLELSPYCKPCTNKQTVDRQRKIKLQAIEYKGGKCIDCGYNKCIAALEFHHLDPSTKDLSMNWRLRSFEKIKFELDKCVLLCCRCHRERHNLNENDL